MNTDALIVNLFLSPAESAQTRGLLDYLTRAERPQQYVGTEREANRQMERTSAAHYQNRAKLLVMCDPYTLETLVGCGVISLHKAWVSAAEHPGALYKINHTNLTYFESGYFRVTSRLNPYEYVLMRPLAIH